MDLAVSGTADRAAVPGGRVVNTNRTGNVGINDGCIQGKTHQPQLVYEVFERAHCPTSE